MGTGEHSKPTTGSRESQTPQTSSKRRHRLNKTALIGMLIILVGVLALLYPYASDYLNRVEQAKVGQTQQETVASMPPEDLSAEWERARQYNADLLRGTTYVVDPFDPNAPRATDEEYVSCLNINGDGVMGSIVIPAIDVNLPIYHGTEGDFMSTAAGHVVNTTLPVGGEGTHAVLAAHTGVPSAVLFDNLDRLQVGDYFVLRILDQDLAYRVYDIEVVLPDETSSLGIQEGRDLVTLVTCTPYGVNSHRLLVHAERCDVPAEFYDDAEGLPPQVASLDAQMPPSLLEVLLVLAAVFVVVWAISCAARAAAHWRRERARR